MLRKGELEKIREECEAFETWRRISCHVVADLLEACAACGMVREKERLVRCYWCRGGAPLRRLLAFVSRLEAARSVSSLQEKCIRLSPYWVLTFPIRRQREQGKGLSFSGVHGR